MRLFLNEATSGSVWVKSPRAVFESIDNVTNIVNDYCIETSVVAQHGYHLNISNSSYDSDHGGDVRVLRLGAGCSSPTLQSYCTFAEFDILRWREFPWAKRM